jgi:hypothetical protein
MATTYQQFQFPDPPQHLPKDVRDYLQKLVTALRDSELRLKRALDDQEPVASLKVLGIAPDRSQDGDEVEVDATLGATGDFGSGAGKYVRRSSAWVYLG